MRRLLRRFLRQLWTLITMNNSQKSFFEGKSALITGGSSGIGLALAKKMVEQGCHVAILSRQEQLLQEAEKTLQRVKDNETTKISIIQADVTLRDELNQALDKHIAANGIPDIVINSAGVAHPGTFTVLKPELFEWMMNVNYFGTVNVLKHLVPAFKARRSGSIVNISSIAGFLGIYGYTAYSASKFAVNGFTDALRSELKPYNIHVSIVFPPDTKTPQLEYEKEFKPFITQELAGSANLMEAEQVADEVLKKLAQKKYIILPGFEGKLLFLVKNLLGKNLHPVLDLMVNNSIRKLKLG